MTKRKKVPSLQDLALKSVGSLIVHMTPYITANLQIYNDSKKIPQCLKPIIDKLSDLLITHVPHYLYETMAVEVLTAIELLIEKTKKKYCPYIGIKQWNFLTELNVAVNLTAVVLTSHLKSISFSQWPQVMCYVLFENLDKMTNLQFLDFGLCTNPYRGNQDLYNEFEHMKLLQSISFRFSCNDSIIKVISENCPLIQSIDVISSCGVTNKSVQYLLNCKQLKVLKLHCTSVTLVGLAKLIYNLPFIEDIGCCDEFKYVVDEISKLNRSAKCVRSSFALRKIHTCDLSTERLRLVVDFFPNLEYLSIVYNAKGLNLNLLTSLKHIKKLSLLSFAFYRDHLLDFLKSYGTNLTSLHLEHVGEIDYNALVDIGKLCVNLKSLVLYNCDLMSVVHIQPPSYSIAPLFHRQLPFQNLERLFWVVDGATDILEFIILSAINIRFIHLGQSTGITHKNIVNILKSNPLKYLEELKILYSSDMHMGTVELLLSSCTNLTVLSDLESWDGIKIDDLKMFKHRLIKNNIDLDIRPVLSTIH